MKAIIVGVLMGGSLLILGIGLRKTIPGLIAMAVEFGIAMLSSPAAVVSYLILLFVLMLLPAKDTSITANRTNKTVFEITAESGPLQGRQFQLSEKNSALSIGRENCDIQFPADTAGVGRKHCEVLLQNGVPLLHDLHSSYGTFILNPTRQLASGATVALEDGNRFCLARSDIVFRITLYSNQ